MELQELVERIQRWKRKQTPGYEETSDLPGTAYESGAGDDSAVAMVAPRVVFSAPDEMAGEELDAEELSEDLSGLRVADDNIDVLVDSEQSAEQEPEAANESEGDIGGEPIEEIDDLDAIASSDIEGGAGAEGEGVWADRRAPAEELPNLEEDELDDDEDEDTK